MHRSTITVAVGIVVLLGSIVNPAWFGSPGDGAAALSWIFHLVGYAALAAAVRPLFGPGWRGVGAAVAVATGFGAGVELVQVGLAYRTGSVADAALNAVGSVAGVTVARAVRRLWPSPSTDP
ncbi:VanZ family protein [Haloplanus salilacus]|uniref:VanZ family protein n=1 Tax=Haloplanus salilacus TaxID=2949994 RepID=UPI0030CE6EA3